MFRLFYTKEQPPLLTIMAPRSLKNSRVFASALSKKSVIFNSEQPLLLSTNEMLGEIAKGINSWVTCSDP